MNEREKRLGRGLESLIGGRRDSHDQARGVDDAPVRSLGVAVIEPNPYQPRKTIEAEALSELAASMRRHGLLQPIVVRPRSGRFQVIAGERRWRAARELGWSHIEAHVVEADDERMLEWALIENVQREDLGPIELADAYRRLQESADLTQDEVARAVGKSRAAVANTLRLLDLSAGVKDRVSRGTVSMGAARALLGLEDVERQESVARDIEAGRLNVRQVEALVARARRQPARRASPRRDPNLDSLASELQMDLGTKVAMKGSLGRGRIVIEYYTAGQLDRLVRRLREAGDGQAGGEAPSEGLAEDFSV